MKFNQKLTWPDKQSILLEPGRILGFPPHGLKSPPPLALPANSLKQNDQVERISSFRGTFGADRPVAAGAPLQAKVVSTRG